MWTPGLYCILQVQAIVSPKEHCKAFHVKVLEGALGRGFACSCCTLSTCLPIFCAYDTHVFFFFVMRDNFSFSLELIRFIGLLELIRLYINFGIPSSLCATVLRTTSLSSSFLLLRTSSSLLPSTTHFYITNSGTLTFHFLLDPPYKLWYSKRQLLLYMYYMYYLYCLKLLPPLYSLLSLYNINFILGTRTFSPFFH